MTPEDIEIHAMHNEELPKGLELPEQLLFMAFRCLHQSYRERQITCKQAHAEKLKLLDSFDIYMRWDGIYRDTCKMRVGLSKVSKDMVKGNCPICKKAVAVIDGSK